MDYARFGSSIRMVRIRLGLRQVDAAAKAGVSRAKWSRIERAICGAMTLDEVEAVGRVLGMRIDLVPRWRGMDLPRLLDRDHAALAEAVINRLRALGWDVVPEVTFSVYGERGSIDLLAWHAASRSLLVIELKTAVVDLQDTLSTMDRKRRLAPELARARGWTPLTISVWLAVGDTRTNRRHVLDHAGLLGATFPVRGVSVTHWLRDPVVPISGLSFVPYGRLTGARPGLQRVSPRRHRGNAN